jgi:hypothetical protein
MQQLLCPQELSLERRVLEMRPNQAQEEATQEAAAKTRAIKPEHTSGVVRHAYATMSQQQSR